MAGPPTSICSMQAAKSAPDGERGLERVEVDHDQVDRRRGRARASVARCSGRSRRARMPPWTPGCSVLTRPSRISGAPVRSPTSTTAHVGRAQGRGGAAGGDQLDALGREPAAELDQAGLVVHREQRAADRAEGHRRSPAASAVAAAQPGDEEAVDPARRREIAGQGAHLAGGRQVDRQALAARPCAIGSRTTGASAASRASIRCGPSSGCSEQTA